MGIAFNVVLVRPDKGRAAIAAAMATSVSMSRREISVAIEISSFEAWGNTRSLIRVLMFKRAARMVTDKTAKMGDCLLIPQSTRFKTSRVVNRNRPRRKGQMQGSDVSIVGFSSAGLI